MAEDHARGSIRVHVSIRGSGASDRSIAGEITDLSESGLFLATNSVLSPGKEMNIKFQLPTADGSLGDVEARVEVKRRETNRGKTGNGLRFLRLPMESQEVIKSFLNRARLELSQEIPIFVKTATGEHIDD